MSAANNGGLAFPCPESERHYREDGMSLRDYFAAKVVEGMLSSPHLKLDIAPEQLAATAFEYADAMLKARAS